MQIQNAVALVTVDNGGIGKNYVEGLRASGESRIYVGARNPDSLMCSLTCSTTLGERTSQNLVLLNSNDSA